MNRVGVARRGMVIVLVAIVSFSSCVDFTPDMVIRRDSLGVEIVESFGPIWGDSDAWTIDSVPLLDLTLTGSGDDHEFYRVRDLTRLRDQSIVVADDGSDEVRYYDSAGNHLRSVGRNGSGPGEFQELGTVSAYRGDSIFAYDDGLGRATVIDDGYRVARVVSQGQVNVRLAEAHVLEDGRFVGVIYSFAELESYSGLTRMPHNVVLMSATGVGEDTLFSIAGFESFFFEGGGDGRPLFGKTGHVAVYGEQVYAGTADSVEFEVWGLDGGLVRISRVPGFDLTLTGAEVREERNARTPPGAPERFQRMNDLLPDPVARPGYEDLLVDQLGFVWLARARGWGDLRARAAIEWMVFDPGGAWLGWVRTADRFAVMEVGADYILGVWYDDLDVEHVQIRGLKR